MDDRRDGGKREGRGKKEKGGMIKGTERKERKRREGIKRDRWIDIGRECGKDGKRERKLDRERE